MNVAVIGVAADTSRVGGVGQIEEDQATEAVLITGASTDGDTVVGLLVDDDVVGRADGQLVEVTGQILLVAEEHGGILGGDVEELFRYSGVRNNPS